MVDRGSPERCIIGVTKFETLTFAAAVKHIAIVQLVKRHFYAANGWYATT